MTCFGAWHSIGCMRAATGCRAGASPATNTSGCATLNTPTAKPSPARSWRRYVSAFSVSVYCLPFMFVINPLAIFVCACDLTGRFEQGASIQVGRSSFMLQFDISSVTFRLLILTITAS